MTLPVMIRPTSRIQYLNINASRLFQHQQQQRFFLFSRAFKQTPTHDFNVIHPQPRIATSSVRKSKLTTSFTLPAQKYNSSTQSKTSNSAEMSSKLIPSDPDHVMVIRNVTPNIATFSVPFSRFGKVKIGGRGTLVKLTSGGLAIFSPVALTKATQAKVMEMGGDVRYIVALDYEHHIFISEWKKEYPSAKIIGPEGLPEKRAKQTDDPKINDDEFAVVFKKENKREIKIDPEFDADFDYEYVDGHANLEIVFFYKPEQVLIQADLLFNLPPTEQYSKVPESELPADGAVGKLFACVQNPRGDTKWLQRFNWYLLAKNRKSFNDSMAQIAKWDFHTMIPCHGDVLEGDGKEVFMKVFDWHLQGHK